MTTIDPDTPGNHAFNPPPDPFPKSPALDKINIPRDQLTSFLIQITQGVWRLESAVERSRIRGEPIPQEFEVTIERIHEDLESFGVEVNDPAGKTYEPGMRVEVAQLEPGGSGDLVVKQTILAGVSFNGAMVKPASVVIGRRVTS